MVECQLLVKCCGILFAINPRLVTAKRVVFDPTSDLIAVRKAGRATFVLDRQGGLEIDYGDGSARRDFDTSFSIVLGGNITMEALRMFLATTMTAPR